VANFDSDNVSGYTINAATTALTAISGSPFAAGSEPISVAVRPQFAGKPGETNCHGASISALAKQFGGLDAAAQAVGFVSVQAMQDAIRAFCQ
jgi:hypothetical protein